MLAEALGSGCSRWTGNATGNTERAALLTLVGTEYAAEVWAALNLSRNDVNIRLVLDALGRWAWWVSRWREARVREAKSRRANRRRGSGWPFLPVGSRRRTLNARCTSHRTRCGPNA